MKNTNKTTKKLEITRNELSEMNFMTNIEMLFESQKNIYNQNTKKRVMTNINLLFEHNKNDNTKMLKKYYKFRNDKGKKYWLININNHSFSGKQIHKLICILNNIIETDKFKFPIKINLNTITFADKLVYIVLECICLYLIFNQNRDIILNYKHENHIGNSGIEFSPLNQIKYNCNQKLFYECFFDHLSKRHFRKIIINSEIKTSYLNIVLTSIYKFLENLSIDRDTIGLLCEAIIEVVGNAIEHDHSDCLIDIDVTDDNYKKIGDNENNSYYGVNVVVLNFSHTPFYKKLQDKLLSCKTNLNERYTEVQNAKSKHSEHFSNEYTESDFYTIASFQHKISGSVAKGESGGVGLTTLIKSLEEKSDGNYCYMLSEKRVLFFYKDLLKHNSNNFLGFNRDNDFLNRIPDLSIFRSCDTFFPETSYNLHFTIRKDE